MTLQTIPTDSFLTRPFPLFNRQWLLLTGGNFAKDEFNTMTISWGSLGILWNKPIVQVFVRPTRYTYEFMERYKTFTVTAFPESFHGALQILGSRSGRHGNKIAEAGLTPMILDPAVARVDLTAIPYAPRELASAPLHPPSAPSGAPHPLSSQGLEPILSLPTAGSRMIATQVDAPTFAEAELSLECRKIYFDDLNPAQFIDPTVHENYPEKDFHRMYFGEIITIQGAGKYLAP